MFVIAHYKYFMMMTMMTMMMMTSHCKSDRPNISKTVQDQTLFTQATIRN